MDEPEARPDAGEGVAEPQGQSPEVAGEQAQPEEAGAAAAPSRATRPGGGSGRRAREAVTGTVLAVHRDEVLMDVGAKADGVLALPEAEAAGLSPGDRVQVRITGFDPETGAPRLARSSAPDPAVLQRIEDAQREGTALEGVVREQVKGGLVLDVGMRAFMPASQVERGYVADLAPYVGQTLRAKLLEFDRARNKVILSRRALLEEEARQRREAIWAELEEGQIREGVVKGLTDFGAFIDLGGVDGLLHVSAMSWDRVERPGDVVQVGQPIRVRVLRLDRERQKISLGLKQVDPDPWSTAPERYPVGSVVEGRVMRLCSFGAFVQLQPGLDGLIHLSQLSEERVREPGEVVQEGQTVRVRVLRVSPAERRISLSLREAPATEARETAAPGAVSAAPRPAETVTLADMVGDIGDRLKREFGQSGGA